MAASLNSHQQSIEEMVTCPICMERMESPKHLSCQHAFCMLCLQDWTKQPGNNPHSISCPVCRKTTKVDSGVHNLPTDISVVRLIDVLNASPDNSLSPPPSSPNYAQHVPTTTTTDTCAHDTSPAVSFCETCQEHLCTNCTGIHKNDNALAYHFIRSSWKHCNDHPTKFLEFFCPQCNVLVCSVCVHGQHTTHKVQAVREVANRARAEIRKACEKHSERIASERRTSVSPSDEEAVDVAMAEIESLIDNQVKKGRKIIEDWQAGILGEVTRMKADFKQKMSASLKEDYMTSIENLLIYCENFQKPDTDLELVSSLRTLRDRLNEAEKIWEWLHVSQQVLKDLIFVPENIPPSLGRITSASEQEQLRARNMSPSSEGSSVASPVPASPATPQSPAGLYPNIGSGAPQAANSPPSAPNIQTINAPQIPDLIKYGFNVMDDAWSDTGFCFSKKLHNEESMSTSFGQAAVSVLKWVAGQEEESTLAPVDVAIDNNRGYLYVINRGWFTAGSLKRYDFPRDHGMSYSQMVMNELSAYFVSICQSDGTIATSVKSHHVLFTHLRGVIPERVKNSGLIPVDKLFPHTVRDPMGFTITDDHIWVFVDRSYCIVALYKLDDEQKQLKHMVTFGCSGSLPGQFKEPMHVHCDPVRDRIIVADTGNHRVQAFSMQGNFLWESGAKGKNPGEFIAPQGLCMDGAGNILVANTGNKRIDVLSWKNGQYLKSISTDVRALSHMAPHTMALYSPMNQKDAYLVIAGLQGRMPVISMQKYNKGRGSVSSSSSRDYDFGDW